MQNRVVEIKFHHGLGDCANFALLVHLYRRHSIEIRVSGEENKQFIWNATDVITGPKTGLDESWWHPRSFLDLDAPDHEANKVAGNIGAWPLPALDVPRQQLWRELCSIELNVMPSVGLKAHSNAHQFLFGLPAPIIALHAVGTNGQAEKSIDAETQLELQRELVRRGYSVVILDFDARAVQVGHERIRGIKPTWGHVSLEELAALLSRCDLLIGVDSGPLHFARITPIPVLGVFYNRGGLLPHRVAIPSPRLISLVPASLSAIWTDRRGEDVGWNFIEYAGEGPTVDEIANAAGAIIGNRVRSEPEPSTIPGRYLYKRHGFDERSMELLPNGSIGEGQGGNERRWFTIGEQLLISGDHGLIAVMKLDSRQIWCGQWLEFERMPIELVPEAIS